MGEENPIHTLGDYSKPSHEGYRNTIELPEGNNVERTRLRLFQFSLRDQASNWLERLPAGSISTWEDLTTRFLAQFFPLERTAKLHNNIFMFQQHQGESISEAWAPIIRIVDQSADGKLRERNAKESWVLLEDIALYDNESWNGPRDFAKPVKAISLPQDVPSTSDCHLIELENQVQRFMEALLAPKQPQAFVEYASPRNEEVGEELNKNPSSLKCVHFINSIVILSKESEAKGEGSVKPSEAECNDHKRVVEAKEEVGEESEKELEEETDEETEEEEEDDSEYFNTFPTMEELRYHKWLLKNPRPSWVKAKIRTGNLNNVKFSCMIGHFDKKQAYLDIESPINVMSRLHYNWIMSNRLESRRKPSNPKKIYSTSVIDHYLGSCVNIIPLYLFKKLKIRLLEEIDLVFGLADGTKSYPVGIVRDVEVHIGRLKLLNNFYIIDMKKDPETP
ncbi:MAK10-like protein [Tanacetum coccineum]